MRSRFRQERVERRSPLLDPFPGSPLIPVGLLARPDASRNFASIPPTPGKRVVEPGESCGSKAGVNPPTQKSKPAAVPQACSFPIRCRVTYFADCAHFIRMSATSGLENSCGGRSPAFRSSRTLVPLGATLCSGPCGQVLLLTTASHVLHQAVCSNFRIVTPMSLGRSN